MSARRIALVAACPFPSPQGSQVFVGQMAERLAEAGHDVHLVTYGQGMQQSGRGYRHHRAWRLPGDDAMRSGPNLVKPLLDAMLAARLRGVVRDHGIEIMHAHNYEAAIAALTVRARSGVPVVYHSHNLMGDELETYFERPLLRRAASLAGRLLDRSVPRRADRTIALCEWSAARLRASGCRSVEVIPPAVDDGGPLPDPREARRGFGFGEDDFVVGYTGNLDAYQNLPLLVEAFRRLVAAGAEGPPARLLIATHGPFAPGQSGLDGLGGLGEQARVVRVEGYTEARSAMAACDLLALPRRLGSGYPLKLLNFMSAAKPVVSAGCGSKVLRDGVDGIVVADDDAVAMAAAMERCRRDPQLRRALGDEARRTFLARLCWPAVLPRIERVYQGLAATGRQDRPAGLRNGAGEAGPHARPSAKGGEEQE